MHLITPHQLKHELPLNEEGAQFISSSRKTIENLLSGSDPRLLLIIGPCSIHNPLEGLTFAKKLKKLSDEISDVAFIVMRAYIEKPRTVSGWKGLVYDPHLNGSNEIGKGLEISRSFLLELAEMEMPAAIEFLTPHLAPFFEDLITWGCIGARTSASQIHRHLASSLPLPIGFKNTVDGSITTAINGALVARHPQHFLHIDDEGKLCALTSEGNPYTHVVLRGSSNGTNFDRTAIEQTALALQELKLPSRILIDCSHGNAQGNYLNQINVFNSLLEQDGSSILGMMIETHLEEGSQKITPTLQPGVSVTDPCLNFDQLSELVRSISMSLNQS